MTFVVACKRVQVPQKLDRAYSDASHQIEKSKFFGFVSIDMTCVFFATLYGGEAVKKSNAAKHCVFEIRGDPTARVLLEALPAVDDDVRASLWRMSDRVLGALNFLFAQTRSSAPIHFGTWRSSRLVPRMPQSDPKMRIIRLLSSALSEGIASEERLMSGQP